MRGGILILLTLTGCRAARFRESCESVRAGETLAQVKAKMDPVSNSHWKRRDQNQHHWTRSKWFFKVQNCAVDFNTQDRAVRARYCESDDLL